MLQYDYLIVGAGFAGSVCAQRLAELGSRILLIDRRPHIGGNAFDTRDERGVLVHPYGPHIFHTNSKTVFEYLSRFTNWRYYEHRVLAKVADQLLPFPINQTTLHKLYGVERSEPAARVFYERVRETRDPIRTSEDVVISSVGRDLCDKFYRGYTRKQWGVELADLAADVAARITARTNDDDRYFTDMYQFMPANGFTRMFANMLAHPRIEVRLDTDFAEIRGRECVKLIIFTGPFDEYYNWVFGRLPYRSVRFEHQHLVDTTRFQPVGTVNYPNDYDFTRITEFAHLTGEKVTGTSIVREYPTDVGDPYYPILRPETERLLKRYQMLSEPDDNVRFIGRLAQYKYYNMDQVVAAALAFTQQLTG